jgi:glycosyltransferase involved in cell wall biosynthesis
MTTGRQPMTIVIPTRDRPAHLAQSLKAVMASVHGDDEVIVVDSASADPAAIAAIAEVAGVQVIRCDEPGASRARNAGWRIARHDVIGFVDDDVWIDSGWVEAMVRCMAAHPETAFVTGRIDGDATASSVTPRVPRCIGTRCWQLVGSTTNSVPVVAFAPPRTTTCSIGC